jgi:hypothetical protein
MSGLGIGIRNQLSPEFCFVPFYRLPDGGQQNTVNSGFVSVTCDKRIITKLWEAIWFTDLLIQTTGGAFIVAGTGTSNREQTVGAI